MSFFAPLAMSLAPAMNVMGMMARISLAPIALTTLALLSGCGNGNDEGLGGPEDGGRPPQDPVIPDPSDEDPCDGLEGEELLDCALSSSGMEVMPAEDDPSGLSEDPDPGEDPEEPAPAEEEPAAPDEFIEEASMDDERAQSKYFYQPRRSN